MRSCRFPLTYHSRLIVSPRAFSPSSQQSFEGCIVQFEPCAFLKAWLAVLRQIDSELSEIYTSYGGARISSSFELPPSTLFDLSYNKPNSPQLDLAPRAVTTVLV